VAWAREPMCLPAERSAYPLLSDGASQPLASEAFLIDREPAVPMAVKFKNPPIHELVIGARFAPQLRALRSEHIGLLWSRLGRKDFPTVHQKPPLDVPIPSATEFLPMPRFWLESKEDDKLIQVQKNAFLLNWRSRSTRASLSN